MFARCRRDDARLHGGLGPRPTGTCESWSGPPIEDRPIGICADERRQSLVEQARRNGQILYQLGGFGRAIHPGSTRSVPYIGFGDGLSSPRPTTTIAKVEKNVADMRPIFDRRPHVTRWPSVSRDSPDAKDSISLADVALSLVDFRDVKIVPDETAADARFRLHRFHKARVGPERSATSVDAVFQTRLGPYSASSEHRRSRTWPPARDRHLRSVEISPSPSDNRRRERSDARRTGDEQPGARAVGDFSRFRWERPGEPLRGIAYVSIHRAPARDALSGQSHSVRTSPQLDH